MTINVSLDPPFDAFIASQLASGLLEHARAFEIAIQKGLADAEAGRVHDAGAVFDELTAELSARLQLIAK
jgi:hypothetical protein